MSEYTMEQRTFNQRVSSWPQIGVVGVVGVLVLLLHVAMALLLMSLQPTVNVAQVEPTPIAIRWVIPVEAPPEPVAPPVQPVVKPKPIQPKVVPVVNAQPKPLQPKPVTKPKAKPILSTTALSESVQTVQTVQPAVSVTPVASVPVAPPEATAMPSAPATPKTVQGVAYKRQPELIYPESARARGEQGRVLVRVLIDTAGRVQEAVIESSSGSRVLDRAALNIAKQAVFYPYRENGVAQPVYVPMPLEFTLDEE